MTIEEKVREILKKTSTDDEIRFDHEPSERISGFIISEKFAGLDSEARHELIWKQLRSHLTPAERQSVLGFLAFTPEEEQFYTQAYDD